MGRQVMCGGTNQNLSTTVAQSLPWWGFATSLGYQGGNTGLAATAGLDGTFRNLRMVISAAAGGVATRSFTVYLNGAPTALTVAMGSADTDETDATHSFTVAATDLVELRSTLTGVPAACVAFWSLEFEPDSTTQQCVWGSNRQNFGANIKIPPGGGYNTLNSNTENQSWMPSPLAVTVNAIYANHVATVGGVGVGYTYQLRAAGADLAGAVLTVTNGTTGSVTGLSNAVAVGNKLTYQSTRVGGPNSVSPILTIVYTPATPGEYMLIGGSSSGLSAATDYAAFASGAGGNMGAAATFKGLSGPTPWTASLLIAWVLTNPGGGAKSHTVSLYSDGIGALTQSVVLTAADQTAQDVTHSDAIVDGQYIGVQWTHQNSPTASSQVAWGLACAAPGNARRRRTLLGVGI